MEPRIEYAKTDDGVSIAFTVIGQGPAVVLSSVGFGDVNVYSSGSVPWVDQLVAAGRRVALYDGRGTGSSDRDVVDVSLETRVLDLEAVVNRIGLESFALVGRSHGGATAVAFAVRHPGRVTRLVLWDAYIRGSDYYSATAYMRGIKALAGVAEADWELFALTIAHWAVGFKEPERAQALGTAFITGMSSQAYLNFFKASESVDVSAIVPQVSVPTLVIQNRAAVLAVPEAATSLASAIPGAQFVSVRGLDGAAEAVVEFTAGISGTPVEPESRPRGDLRTVLFTDLVGHTEMMSRLGDDRGRDVLREHERITRDVLKANGGTEIKTMGDGFMASFGSVTKAVECAIALQKAFAERGNPDVGARRPFPRDDAAVSDSGTAAEQPLDQRHASPQTPPSTVEPLSVRVGLNAGEPIEEDGDLFGATVILASRIAAEANGGEILVADTVRGLCSGKGFLFSDRGEFVAKGFEEPVRVYEVSWRE